MGPTEKQAQEASSCEYVTEEVSQWRPLRSIAADILIGLAGPTEKQAQEGIWGGRGGPEPEYTDLMQEAGYRMQETKQK